MILKDILAISGKPGLYKLVSTAKNHVVIQSIIDGKKSTAYSSHKISSLEDISIYTYESDVPLADVFQKIKDKTLGEEAISHKSSEKELRSFMVDVLKDYDEDRVYVSDLRKVFQWFNILQKNNLLTDEVEEKEEKKTETAKPKAKAKAQAKPKAKKAAKPKAKAAMNTKAKAKRPAAKK